MNNRYPTINRLAKRSGIASKLTDIGLTTIEISAINAPIAESIITTILAHCFAFHNPIPTNRLKTPRTIRVAPTIIYKEKRILIKGVS